MIIGSQERYIYPDTLKAMCTILVKLNFLFWSVGNELFDRRSFIKTKEVFQTDGVSSLDQTEQRKLEQWACSIHIWILLMDT